VMDPGSAAHRYALRSVRGTPACSATSTIKKKARMKRASE
jgi:hypothetical protein